MRHHLESPLSTLELSQILDDLSAGCEPEFDAFYEELEREFAERRLNFNNAA